MSTCLPRPAENPLPGHPGLFAEQTTRRLTEIASPPALQHDPQESSQLEDASGRSGLRMNLIILTPGLFFGFQSNPSVAVGGVASVDPLVDAEMVCSTGGLIAGLGSSGTCKETSARDMLRVGQALHVSVEKFLALGENIARDSPEAKLQMFEACKDARLASNVVEQICDLRPGIDDVHEPCR